MKRFLIVLAFVAIIATGTAFADHPNGLGIGVIGNYSNWGEVSGTGVGLSLKIPSIPIYWAIRASFGENYYGAGITGDYYLIDKKLAGPLHWFLGVGGYFTYLSYKDNASGVDYTYTWMHGGLRAPIGLSFHPTKLLEIFIDVAPSIGASIYSGYEYKAAGITYNEEGRTGFGWGAPIELGVRLWF